MSRWCVLMEIWTAMEAGDLFTLRMDHGKAEKNSQSCSDLLSALQKSQNPVTYPG